VDSLEITQLQRNELACSSGADLDLEPSGKVRLKYVASPQLAVEARLLFGT
jgi:hypothetical protein